MSNDDRSNTSSGGSSPKFLPGLKFLAYAIIRKNDGEVRGQHIVDRLAECSGIMIDVRSVHSILTRAARDGDVILRSTPNGGGRNVTLFNLTTQGIRVVDEATTLLKTLLECDCDGRGQN